MSDAVKFKVVETSTFYVKTAEQAEYIRKLYEDLQSMIICETSEFSATVEPWERPTALGTRLCEYCPERALFHNNLCDTCDWNRQLGYEPALTFDRPIDTPCAKLEPYAFGDIFPGGCLINVMPSDFHPVFKENI